MDRTPHRCQRVPSSIMEGDFRHTARPAPSWRSRLSPGATLPMMSATGSRRRSRESA